MAYNANIPTPSQRLKDSQPQIQANFQEIQTLIGVNHVNFGASGQGKHIFVSMPVQPSDPGTATGEMALYTKLVSGIPGLFVQQQSNGTAIPIAGAGMGGSGWSMLPSGIIFKWGSNNTGAAGSGYVIPVDSVGGPNFVTVYNIQVSVKMGSDSSSPDQSLVLSVVNPGTVFAYNGAGTSTKANVPFNWLAIGV